MVLISMSSTASELKTQYGTVLSVKPIIELVKEYRPVKVCREVTRKARPQDDSANRLVGGIVGAVIGSKLGHDRGEKVVGAAAGAVIGSNIGEAMAESHKSLKRKRVCRFEDRMQEYERQSGYRVVYRYMGQNFETEMPYDPGPEIELEVSVNPVISGEPN